MEFGVGSILEGKVTGITKFGAFVSLPGGWSTSRKLPIRTSMISASICLRDRLCRLR